MKHVRTHRKWMAPLGGTVHMWCFVQPLALVGRSSPFLLLPWCSCAHVVCSLVTGQIIPGCVLLRLKLGRVSVSPFSLGSHLKIPAPSHEGTTVVAHRRVLFVLPPCFGLCPLRPCCRSMPFGGGALMPVRQPASCCAAVVCCGLRDSHPRVRTASSRGHFFAQQC